MVRNTIKLLILLALAKALCTARADAEACTEILAAAFEISVTLPEISIPEINHKDISSKMIQILIYNTAEETVSVSIFICIVNYSIAFVMVLKFLTHK